MNTLLKSPRLDVVDALRGFSLLAIVLIHNIEHYNLYYIPENMPPFLMTIDQWLWDTIFFLFAGKAYAMFSLLFGFSFYIQLHNQQLRGGDFKWRFAWRMFLLFLFAQFHSAFYPGDILVLYSVVGLVLIPIRNWSNKALLITAFVCLLQPVEWGRIIYALFNPDYITYSNSQAPYFMKIEPILTDGNFWQTIKANIWNGQLYSNIWQVENGRLFQTASLFMFGMLLGRTKMFIKSERSSAFWKKVIIISAAAFIPLFLLKTYIPPMIEQQSLRVPTGILLPSLSNFAFMAILVSGFVLLWFNRDGFSFQRIFIPYGRMSLTNYISQSIIGTFIYFGYGLGMYQYLGSTASVMVGIIIFTIQLMFSRWWLSRHKQGPFEYLWKKGTWILK